MNFWIFRFWFHEHFSASSLQEIGRKSSWIFQKTLWWLRKCQNFTSNNRYDQNASVSEPDQTWLYETSVLLYCMCSVKCIFTCWKKHTSSCGFTCNWCGILMVQKYCSILFFRFFFSKFLNKEKVSPMENHNWFFTMF